MKHLVALLGSIIWISGFVLAKGTLSTIACIFPPWAYYVVIEFVLLYFGIIT